VTSELSRIGATIAGDELCDRRDRRAMGWWPICSIRPPAPRSGAEPAPPNGRRDLFIGRIGCQWRYLPERYVAWTAVWAQWRRWRANGVWAAAMSRLASIVRVHEREAAPSM
jgi:hypothetical protein